MDSFIKGLYIAPEKVENVCCHSTFIAQMFLYGDSLRSSCVAIVVPDEEVLTQWAQEHGKADKSFEELCSDEVLKYSVLKSSELRLIFGSLHFHCTQYEL